MANSTDSEISSSGQARWFTTTHWSLVLSAQDTSSPLAAAALEKLCRAYWYPLYVYVRRQGEDEESAKDLTQGFFARLLEKHYLGPGPAREGQVPFIPVGLPQAFPGGRTGQSPRPEAGRRPDAGVAGRLDGRGALPPGAGGHPGCGEALRAALGVDAAGAGPGTAQGGVFGERQIQPVRPR